MGETNTNWRAWMSAAAAGLTIITSGAAASAQEELAATALSAGAVEAAEIHPLVAEFASMMEGSFTSEAHAARSPGLGVVEAELVRVWPDRDDGVWLYQESAFIGPTPDTVDQAAKARPFFQRIHRLTPAGPAEVRRTIYELTDSSAVVGAWRTPETTPRDILGPPLCGHVAKRFAEGHWVVNSDCPNDYFGSNRVVSQEMYTPDAMVSWTRGYDLTGSQLWGPTGTGYIMKRKAED